LDPNQVRARATISRRSQGLLHYTVTFPLAPEPLTISLFSQFFNTNVRHTVGMLSANATDHYVRI